jgi:hypothetical protein
MVEQLTGAAIASVLILGYFVLVQVLMAACVLLSQFLVLQLRALHSLIGSRQSQPVPAEPASNSYRVGGGIRRWQ